jgi:hypothetical protein
VRHHLAMGLILLLTGCATPLTPRESGTLAGASIGAATGAILGGIAGSAGEGAAIGAAVGAVAGALTGDAIQNEQAARAYPPGSAYGAPPYPYYPPYSPSPPNATLQIQATPDDTEIAVDGRRIGKPGVSRARSGACRCGSAPCGVSRQRTQRRHQRGGPTAGNCFCQTGPGPPSHPRPARAVRPSAAPAPIGDPERRCPAHPPQSVGPRSVKIPPRSPPGCIPSTPARSDIGARPRGSQSVLARRKCLR